ncbi:MAG: efflux RND transporter permease subunit [Gemmatimonadota bacterium]|nr:efflux RND transporter permease subunit [Gemmatimonadota bacterium]
MAEPPFPAGRTPGAEGGPADDTHGGILRTVVGTSLRHRWVVITLGLLLIGYGAFTLARAKYDVFPEFAPPQVAVQTEAPGLAPEQVELLVTQPIETALQGLPGIQSLRSSSIFGLSVATVVFDPSSDIYRDRQMVAERLSTVQGSFLAGVDAPVITPLTSSTATVLIIGLTSDHLSPMALRTEADWTVKRRLLAVPGVANVQVFGGEVKQYQVQLEPDRLVRFGLSVPDVVAAAQRATSTLGAGFISTPNQQLTLRAEVPAPSAAELARTVVASVRGQPVRLGDVASVAEASAPAIGAAAVMGKPGVRLLIEAQYGANTLEVTRAVEAALHELEPALRAEGVTLYPSLFRPADFIERATRNIRASLLIGGVLVLLVLGLFLADVRTAAISYAAIPLSLLASVAVMAHFGYSLNTMTLGGLAVAIGVVVDDAVIDVENIVRRLRLNRVAPTPRPAWQVVLDAALEVRSPVVYATFAVLLVFAPVLVMSGLAGRLFSPLGVAFVLAVLASLVVAVTITPALSLVLLATHPPAEAEPRFTQWVKARYHRVAMVAEGRPGVLLAGVGVLAVIAAVLVPQLGGAFIPQLKEGSYIVHMNAVPGTSLEQSIALGDSVTAALLRLPYVRSVAQQAGRAELGEDIVGPNSSELDVELKPLSGNDAERADAAIRRVIGSFAGAMFSMNTFLVERVDETISGYRAPVAVSVYGSNLDSLDRAASQIASVLGTVPGALDVALQSPPGMPQLAIHLRPAALARLGLTTSAVMDAVHVAYAGQVVGQEYQGNRVFDVSVILAPGTRDNPAKLGALPVRNADGTYVPLDQLADIYETDGREVVQHDGGRRVETVTANVAGADVAGFVRAAQAKLSREVHLPAGSYLEFAGTAEEQAASRHELLVNSAMAAVGIVILLSLVTGGWQNLLLVLANVPFALVGGVFAEFLVGGTLSIGTLVGFVTLFGITVRNSILLISHYEHLVQVEGRTWNAETAIAGAMDRFTPIVMTTLVTGLGLLPLAAGMNAPGREIEGPMAVVILGGLLTSMVLNLVVLPSLSLRFGRFETRQAEIG